MESEKLESEGKEVYDEKVKHKWGVLHERYTSFSINEAWVNRDIMTGEKISSLFHMNGTIYDQVICDVWFGDSPHAKTLPKGFEKRPMLLAFVKKPYPLFY